MKILLVNTNYETPNIHIERAIYTALKADAESIVIRCTYADVAEAASSFKPDLLLALDGQRIMHPIFEITRRYAGLQVLWTFDDPYVLNGPNGTRAASHLFDAVFTNEASSVSAYDVPAYHLPLAAVAPEELGLSDKLRERIKYDVFFCGSAWPNRISVLHSLLKARPNLKYRLSVPYKASLHNYALPFPLSSYALPMHFREFLRAAMQSRVVLNLHRRIGGLQDDLISTTPGPRLFEIGATGSPQIAEEAGLEIKPYYAPDSEYIGFSTTHDLVSKIDFLLTHPDKGFGIGAAARARTLASHTYPLRLDTLKKQVAAVPPRRAKPPARRKRRLLWVVHSTIDAHVAGLEIHQDVLKRNLSHTFDVYFMVGRKTEGRFDFVALDGSYKKIDSTTLNISGTTDLLTQRELEKFFSSFCHAYEIDLVHFFHFMHNVPSLGVIARSLGIPYVISVHDFYIACREFNLLDYNNKFCRNTRDRPLQCDICLSSKYDYRPGSQLHRREFFGRVLGAAHSVIYMSRSTMEIFRGIYPHIFDDESRHRVHGAPLPAPRASYARKRKQDSTHDNLKIVVLGNLEPNKGGQLLASALPLFERTPIEFHVHGKVNPAIEKTLSAIKQPKIVMHGKYDPGGVPLSGYDLSLHLSIWPETYCQTLSEAWASGVVPIVTDIGALGERVEDSINGFLVDPEDSWTLFQVIDRLCTERSLIDKARANIHDGLFLEQKRHAEMYEEAYDSALQGREPRLPPTSKTVQGYGLHELQMQPRSTSWAHGPKSHPPSPIVAPSAGPLPIFPADLDWTVSGEGSVEELLIESDEETSLTPSEAQQRISLPPGSKITVRGRFMSADELSRGDTADGFLAFVDAEDPYKETFLVIAKKRQSDRNGRQPAPAGYNGSNLESAFVVPKHSELIGRYYYMTFARRQAERLVLMPSRIVVHFSPNARRVS